MLNSHPDIAAPPECGFLQWWYGRYGDWTATNYQEGDLLSEFADDVMASRKMETWKLDKSVLINALRNQDPASYGEACSIVYQVWYDINTSDFDKALRAIVDKNNYYINHLEEIDLIWPDAKYIFMTRDGRDVAASYLDLQDVETDSPYAPNLPSSIKEIADEWIANNERTMAFLAAKSDKQHLWVRYEDLVREPESTLREVLSFIDASYREVVHGYYLHNHEPEATIDWKQRTLQPPDSSRIGRYLTRLTCEEIETFESRADSLLNLLGYTGNSPVESNPPIS